MTSILFTQTIQSINLACIESLAFIEMFKVLQTQITAMAAAGDAAQEKVFKLTPIHQIHLTCNLKGGTVSEGSTFAASNT